MKKLHYIFTLTFLLVSLTSCFSPKVGLNDVLNMDDTQVNLTTRKLKLINSTHLTQQTESNECNVNPLPDGCVIQAKNTSSLSVTFPNKQIDVKPRSLNVALGMSKTLQLQIDKRITADATPIVPQTMRLHQAKLALEFSDTGTFQEGAEAKDINMVFTLDSCVDDASNAQKQLCSYTTSSNTAKIFNISMKNVDKLYELITAGQSSNTVAITLEVIFDQLKHTDNTNAYFPATAIMITTLQEGATTVGF